MERESIRVTRSVLLPLSEIDIRVSRSSGPGGQHAQKSSTRVEASFDVEASAALTDVQRRRVIARAGPVFARSPRTSAVRPGTASWRSSGSSRSCATRSPSRGGGSPRDRPRAARSGGSRTSDVGADETLRRPPATNRLDGGGRAPACITPARSFRASEPGCSTTSVASAARSGRSRMELSDAVADHMNIRRGEVHEVVSFYSFLQVPTDAIRVCTGPVCDCFGARELLARDAGCDRGRVPRPLRPRARDDARRRDRPRGHARDERGPPSALGTR